MGHWFTRFLGQGLGWGECGYQVSLSLESQECWSPGHVLAHSSPGPKATLPCLVG